MCLGGHACIHTHSPARSLEKANQIAPDSCLHRIFTFHSLHSSEAETRIWQSQHLTHLYIYIARVRRFRGIPLLVEERYPDIRRGVYRNTVLINLPASC